MDSKIYFEKPIIASYTEIAALLCVVQDKSPVCTLWKYQLYGNLCWEHKSHILYLCGKYNHYTYKEFEGERRICLHKLSKKTSCDEIKTWIDKGFYVLVPINTKFLGITEYPYKHNVFLAGYEDEDFIVYDFWTPGFQWKHKKINGEKFFHSIDFSNVDTVQAFYVFKENKIMYSNDTLSNIKERYMLFSYNWEKKENEQYSGEKRSYGITAYSSLCDYLASLSTFNLTDCQNFHVIYDYLNFTRYCLEAVFGELTCIQYILEIYTDLISRANKLRTLAYKYYIAKKDICNQREIIVSQVYSIQEDEKIARDCIKKAVGLKL